MIKRKNIEKNREILFVFGDNDERKGFGGMAKEFRGEINSIGIRTKKSPSSNLDAYYNDSEYEENCRKISEDVKSIIKKSKDYVGVWFTRNIGQGLADLPKKAPKTFEFLMKEFDRLEKALNTRNKKGF